MQLGALGACSVTFMVRTALFPECRSRNRNSTPVPRELFALLADTFRNHIATAEWTLPTLAECMSEIGPVTVSPAASVVAGSSPKAAAAKPVRAITMHRPPLKIAAKGDIRNTSHESDNEAIKRRRIIGKTPVC